MEDKISESKKTNRPLPDERYNIELYKKAVRASKEAKKIAEEEKMCGQCL